MEPSDHISLRVHILWVLWSFEEQVHVHSSLCSCGPLELTGGTQAAVKRGRHGWACGLRAVPAPCITRAPGWMVMNVTSKVSVMGKLYESICLLKHLQRNEKLLPGSVNSTSFGRNRK